MLAADSRPRLQASRRQAPCQRGIERHRENGQAGIGIGFRDGWLPLHRLRKGPESLLEPPDSIPNLRRMIVHQSIGNPGTSSALALCRP